MVKLLYKTAAEMGGELIIRAMGEEGFLMVVEVPEETGFPVCALAVRVDSALKLDDGATWLLGQLSVRTIAEIADWAADEDVSIHAGSCDACGGGAVYTIDQRIDADASESDTTAEAAEIEPASGQLLISAALQLSIVASQVRGGELSPEQVQSELLRMSKLLSDGVHDETGLRAA
jgi:hypothetical protein